MNLSSLFGLAAGALVIGFAVTAGVPSSQIFFNVHAMIVVAGGTIAASVVCFSLPQLKGIFGTLASSLSVGNPNEARTIVDQLVRVSKCLNSGGSIEEVLNEVRHPFLKESLLLMDQGGLQVDELRDVLVKRIDLGNERLRRDSIMFKTIGRFPPAFGLIGTTIGMVGLLSGLGSPRAFEQLGPAMSLALVATFYGLVLSNIILIPIGENLLQKSDHDLVLRRLVVDGILLIKIGKHPVLVKEFLVSYLPPEKRTLAVAA